MKTLKILMIGSDISVKGGIASVIKQLINFEWNNKVEIKTLSSHIEGHTLKKIIHFNMCLFKLVKILNSENIDIVHVHMSYKGSFIRKNLIIKICKKYNKKVVLHMHGSEFKVFYEKSGKRKKAKIEKLLLECDKVLVLGENWEKYIRGINKNINTEIILNSIKGTQEIVKNKKNEFNIVFLGTLIKRKGVYDLIEAIKLLIIDGNIDKRICVYIGGDGVERGELEAAVDKYNLKNQIKFLGWIQDKEKNEILKKSQLFVLPSYNEGLPVAILEAISYGLPVISTKVGSIDEAVKDNENGFLIEPSDIENLKNKIKYMIEEEEEWEKFSSKSKEIINEKFEERKNLDNLYDIYKSIV